MILRTRYFNPQICTPQNTSCMKNHANGTLLMAQKVSKEYMLSTFFLMGHLAVSNYPEGCFWLVLVALINIIGDSKRNYPEGFQSGTNEAGAQLTPGNSNLAPFEILLRGPPHPTNRTLLQKWRFFHSRGAQFWLGTRTYRFVEKTQEKSAFARIGRVFAEAARNRKITHSALSVEEQACGTSHQHGSQQFRFLDKALLSPDGSVCSSSEVEEAKSVLSLVPIWASCLEYATVFSQTSTLFTKQGATMDRSIGSSFEIPAASLQSFIGLSIIILIPIYDVVQFWLWMI